MHKEIFACAAAGFLFCPPAPSPGFYCCLRSVPVIGAHIWHPLSPAASSGIWLSRLAVPAAGFAFGCTRRCFRVRLLFSASVLDCARRCFRMRLLHSMFIFGFPLLFLHLAFTLGCGFCLLSPACRSRIRLYCCPLPFPAFTLSLLRPAFTAVSGLPPLPAFPARCLSSPRPASAAKELLFYSGQIPVLCITIFGETASLFYRRISRKIPQRDISRKIQLQ